MPPIAPPKPTACFCNTLLKPCQAQDAVCLGLHSGIILPSASKKHTHGVPRTCELPFLIVPHDLIAKQPGLLKASEVNVFLSQRSHIFSIKFWGKLLQKWAVRFEKMGVVFLKIKFRRINLYRVLAMEEVECHHDSVALLLAVFNEPYSPFSFFML